MARPVNEFRDGISLNRIDPLGATPVQTPKMIFENAELDLSAGRTLRYVAALDEYQVLKGGVWVSITDAVDPTLFTTSSTSLIDGGFISPLATAGAVIGAWAFAEAAQLPPTGPARGEFWADTITTGQPSPITIILISTLDATGADKTAELQSLAGGQMFIRDAATQQVNIYTLGAMSIQANYITFRGVVEVDKKFDFVDGDPYELDNAAATTTTSITVSAGRGKIMDIWTDPANVGHQDVQWAQTVMTVQNVGQSFGGVAIAVDEQSNIVEIAFPLNADTWRDYVVLGFVFWKKGGIVQVVQAPHVVNQQELAFYDYIEYIGLPTRRSGLTVSDVTGQIEIWVDRGNIFQPGIAWTIDRKNPHIAQFAARGSDTVAAPFTVLGRDGTVISEGTTQMPYLIDDTPGAAPSPLTGNKATIHYLFALWSGELLLQLGQNEYPDGTEARNTLADDRQSIQVFPGATECILLAQIWVQNNAHSFANSDQAGINNSITSVGGGVAAPVLEFLQLSDTPATYAGHGGAVVRVKNDESGIEFGTGSEDAKQITIEATQANHGFVVGNWIYKKSDGNWALAVANNERTLSEGMVSHVTAGTFTVVTYGSYIYPANHGLTVGEDYYLDSAVAGHYTDIEPSAVGTFTQTLFRVLDARGIKILDQAVVDNTSGQSITPVNVNVPAYAAGQNYQSGDLVQYRNIFYQITTNISGSPNEFPYNFTRKVAEGSAAQYRQTVTAGVGTWVKLCEIAVNSSGNIMVAGSGSTFSMQFACTGVRISANVDFSNEADIQYKDIKFFQVADNNPFQLWANLTTFAIDWTVDFKFDGVSNSQMACVFTQPIVASATDPTGIEKLAFEDIVQNDAGNFLSAAGTGAGVPTGTIITFCSISPPDGFVLCDGSQFNPITYPDLYQILGNSDRLPDLRDHFLRGARNQGQITGFTKHSDSTKPPNKIFFTENVGEHSHSYYSGHGSHDGVDDGHYNSGEIGYRSTRNNTSREGSHVHRITGGGDNETAPIHVYVAYHIKT